jgi:nucleoside-diphosphate-sugar epimerase
LRIFRMAAAGFLIMPRNTGARLSLAHVDDAAAAILASFARDKPDAAPLEFDDGSPGGHSWRTIAGVAREVLGRPVRTLPLPDGVLYAAGWASGLAAQMTGRATVLTRQKVNELLHADWVARPPGVPGYQPAWNLLEGFRNTAQWAASRGLVRMFQAN